LAALVPMADNLANNRIDPVNFGKASGSIRQA
jgi:hypothetical protein